MCWQDYYLYTLHQKIHGCHNLQVVVHKLSC